MIVSSLSFSARLAEVYRVLKPTHYGLVWALPRTSHWTATALEDAGFEIRDRISHLFGTGLPKGKGCLKPACEDWWLIRKPGKGVRELGIDDCRIAANGDRLGGGDCNGSQNHTDGWDRPWRYDQSKIDQHSAKRQANVLVAESLGRWPANLVLSHHEECRHIGVKKVRGVQLAAGSVEVWECHPDCPVRMLDEQNAERTLGTRIGDSGGVSRFFYCAKASRRDRGEYNTHPTVKNTALMEWLVKLACPSGGVVLDPFAGSGSTGVACVQTGRKFIGIEIEPTYHAIAQHRIAAAQAENPLFVEK